MPACGHDTCACHLEGFTLMLRRIWPWLLILARSCLQQRFRAGSVSASEPGCLNRARTPGLEDSHSRRRVQRRPACQRALAMRRYAAAGGFDHARSAAGPGRSGSKVKVSFIIGADGRVHSPLILQSAGPAGDRNVLQTVRTWRYRPATCNGVPTEAEGKIEFSRR